MMTSVFLVRKPRFLEVKEEPQLVSAGAGTRVQTGQLQGTLGHLLCIERVSSVSDAVCWLPTWLCGCSPLQCQVLHELDLSHSIRASVSVQEAAGKEALMNVQGQLQFVQTRLSSVSPGPWQADPAPLHPSTPPGARPPAVPACLHAGSWKAWQQPHPAGFLSGMNLSPSELRRKITRESLVLTWGWDGGVAQSSLF